MESEKSIYELRQQLNSTEYDGLIRAIATVADYFGFVQLGNPKYYCLKAVNMINYLSPFMIENEKVSSWPGTYSPKKFVRHRLYKITDQTIDSILAATSGLWDWANTDFPDDLHFLRRDRSVVLGSTWCTEHVWLELSQREYRGVVARLPASMHLFVNQEISPNIQSVRA